MEGIIIMIVMFVLSSLFTKGKAEDKKKQTKPMPPFSNQSAPRPREEVRPRRVETKQPKSLEDFANEVFGQLNDKRKPELKPIEKPAKIEVELPKTRPAREIVERNSESKEVPKSNRGMQERPIIQMIKQQEANQLKIVPSNQKELMQAIIMTEILGPPKAKQR
ncbi:hypothetical protein CSE16_05045 [Solibacillus sp. R5-41]|uniref:hypothetical protein n=1 Tax=Solibacillus sp. R5-41 TaxID=2048654 RepID=UPI000C127327|nr:hypothetical protein [Solibacillus sp. R5-41]ATP39464.1 hypothetical protein CSE16_05045 [Solibacillus sp. R5-41]